MYVPGKGFSFIFPFDPLVFVNRCLCISEFCTNPSRPSSHTKYYVVCSICPPLHPSSLYINPNHSTTHQHKSRGAQDHRSPSYISIISSNVQRLDMFLNTIECVSIFVTLQYLIVCLAYKENQYKLEPREFLIHSGRAIPTSAK